eukprot:11883458-Alexandrium_andersonii.AAC.1
MNNVQRSSGERSTGAARMHAHSTCSTASTDARPSTRRAHEPCPRAQSVSCGGHGPEPCLR